MSRLLAMSAVLGATALSAMVSLGPSAQAPATTELMYGRGNNWGGFLNTDGEGLPSHRAANSLTKQDLALLKVAHDEELHEDKEGKAAKSHDMKALHEREKRLAKVKKEQKALHKQQLANLPAPMLKQAKHKTNHLTDKDESLLKVAVGEQHKENKEALQAKKVDEAAEKVKEEQKKAAAAKAHSAHAKHAAAVKQHKNPSASKPSTKSWGGYLPKLSSKNGNGEAHPLDAGAMSLLKSAMADQKHDTAAGKAARARDQAAFKRMGGKMSVSMGKVHEEATKEFQHIEQKADIGLGRATAVDDAENSHAWGHIRG